VETHLTNKPSNSVLPRVNKETRDLAKEAHTSQDHLVRAALKDFLESIPFGRWGIRAIRNIFRTLGTFRDPVQRKLWMSRFSLPLRNAVLRNRPLTASFSGIRLSLVPQGAVAGDIWAGLHSERHDISFLLGALEPGMIVFDVGANAGLFAISAAKKIGGKGVYAFEPRSSTCELLKLNLRLNGHADVNVARVPLGESAGEGVLQVNARGKDGLNTLSQATHPDGKVVSREEVCVTTVDSFVKERSVPRVDFMKVDINGAELMLFRGARVLLERADAPLILYEGLGSRTRGFGYHPVEIIWFLESCGYSLFVLNGATGGISELKPDYQYDTMIIAAKPGRAGFANWRAGSK
jgi:FkbM family methyltransferase